MAEAPLAARVLRVAVAGFLAATALAATAAPLPVDLESMTSPEVREAVAAGRTTVIIPVGGTEQSGPQIALGKHNMRAAVLSRRIAEALGNALVAPVVSYVPEGAITPPAGHMRFAGTLSIPDAAFQGLLDGAARSLARHGFRDIVLIGDHGGYQSQLAKVADRLNRDWAGTPARAHFIADYYAVTQKDYVRALEARGLSPAQIGEHAGTADTALMLAVDPHLVRTDRYAEAAKAGAAEGVAGDPRPATAALGEIGVDLVISRSVAAIRAATARTR